MNNVVAFAPRRQEAPAYRRPEFRLVEDCHVIELTVRDEAGNVEIAEFVLVASSPNFDFDRLRRSWDEWRGGSTIAS